MEDRAHFAPLIFILICPWDVNGALMKKCMLVGVLAGIALLWLAGDVWAQVVVTNFVVAQRTGTKLVDISYDVSSSATNLVYIFVTVSTAGVPVNVSSLSGDIGFVATGNAKSIIWNMGADWNGNLAMVSFSLTAHDNMPIGGDPRAIAWDVVDARWVKNIYSNGAVTMNDRNSGLMWVYDASTNGIGTWTQANNLCNALVYAGYDNWFLPDKYQLGNMYLQNAFFVGVQLGYYWSSSPGYTSGYKVLVNMANGGEAQSVPDGNPVYNSYPIWPCRGQ